MHSILVLATCCMVIGVHSVQWCSFWFNDKHKLHEKFFKIEELELSEGWSRPALIVFVARNICKKDLAKAWVDIIKQREQESLSLPVIQSTACFYYFYGTLPPEVVLTSSQWRNLASSLPLFLKSVTVSGFYIQPLNFTISEVLI